MSNNSSNSFQTLNDDVDILEILLVLQKRLKFILISTLLFISLASIYAFRMPNIYLASTELAPVNEQESLSSQYSGLAAVAGINIGSNEGSKTKEALRILKSLHFFETHIYPFIDLENLFAVKSVDMDSYDITYDDKLFDDVNKLWIKNNVYEWVSSSKYNIQPSPQSAFEEYKSIFGIQEDDDGFVTLSIQHQSPLLAKLWLDMYIAAINSSIIEEDQIRAVNSINYLEKTLATTNQSQVKDAISNLLEQELKKIMFINASDEYVFKIIDPPVVPEKKFKPSRLIILIMATFLGFFLASLIAIIQNYFSKNKNFTS
jgi:LPS O-antigen subunit length determinant protein (WzzB/FepE family)